MNKAYVHLYVGTGKGKTTASIGLSVRAKGSGKKVLIAQFLKGQNTSELTPLTSLGIDIIRTKEAKKFVFQMNEQELELTKQDCEDCFMEVSLALKNHSYDLIVMDEIVDAVNLNLITTKALVDLVKNRPEDIEMVLTGRNPSKEIINIADYYTLMTAEKHPYNEGVPQRKGIEY